MKWQGASVWTGAKGPADHEIEVSVFGPGFGECVLIHLTNNAWVVVDSCLDPASEQAAALHYLRSIGRDPSECIKTIVISHWHDDHVGGLDQVVETASQASVAVSGALLKKEFLAILEATRRIDPRPSSGVSIMQTIFDCLAEDSRRLAVCGPDRVLLRSPAGAEHPFEVASLSPSDDMVVRATQALADMVKPGVRRRGVGRPGRNNTSVALWVSAGDVSVLLGADLEEEGVRGWTTIVETSQVVKSRAEVFKVPHHGSPNGHCALVWDRLLVPGPIAVLTEFNRGRAPRPAQADIDRIVPLSSRVLQSSVAGNRPPVFQERVVKDFVSQCTSAVTVAPSELGHVRLRRGLHGQPDWSVALFGSARDRTPSHP